MDNEMLNDYETMIDKIQKHIEIVNDDARTGNALYTENEILGMLHDILFQE